MNTPKYNPKYTHNHSIIIMETTESTPNLISKSARVEAQGDNDQSFEALPGEESFYWRIVWHKKGGFWCPESLFRLIVSFQRNYRSSDNDILLATMPKSGTTWLKALVFSVVHRSVYAPNQSPLLASNPHELVPFEFQLAKNHFDDQPDHHHQGNINGNKPDNSHLFATHLPYHILPDSIFSSKCKIVYLYRNPLDQFVSEWQFHHRIEGAGSKKIIPLENAFEFFLKGVQNFGPFWDQVLGYWYASLKSPEKIFFLRYEDLKKDPRSGVKKIAQFLQVPFTKEEENNGLIEEIIKLCSFESLANMEVNKPGRMNTKLFVNNSCFFRKGEVGDWVNYLSPEMATRLAIVMKEKFCESGFTFEV